MANLPVISLNAGKLTPLIDTRADTAKYSSGCRILDNMIPLIYGPVTRRPGTKYRAAVHDHDVKSRMVSFIYSATIAYEIEFSDQIINVYYNGSIVDTDIASPYLEADLFQLQFEQSADVMWITHPSYAPRKFSRVSATEFTLDTITFDTGPFIERNDIAEDDDVTIAVTGYTILLATEGISGTGNFTITNVPDISSLFPANKRFYVTNSTADTIDGAYTVDVDTATDYTDTTITIYANETIPTVGAAYGKIMVDGGVVTLAASSATFTTGASGHTGALFKLTHKREKTVTKGTATGTGIIGEAIDVKGNWSFTTHGNWSATVEIQRNEDGTNWETLRTYTSILVDGKGTRNILKTDVEDADGVQYRIYVSAFTDGTVNADLTVDESTQDSIFRITATASTTSATATAIVAANEHVATKRWAEGAWSSVRGYPAAITFFEERAVYGFSTLDGQDIWLSGTGDFEDFDTGTKNDDAFTLTLPTANRGRWLGSLEVLAAGTAGSEWRIRSTAEDEALTPTNFSIKKQTNRGSADIQAMAVNEAIIFVDYIARKIREYTWSDLKQKYVSPDLTALAEDITSGGITSLAVQKNPDAIIWFTISNSPYLISMTYEREQNVVAFAEHPLGGDGIAESICITPSTDEDVITLTVQRTINGSTVRYIEEMQPRDWGDDQKDCFFVDSGLTFELTSLGSVNIADVAIDMSDGKVTVTVDSWPTDLADDDIIRLEDIVGYTYLNDKNYTVADANEGALTFKLKTEDATGYFDGKGFIHAHWKMNDSLDTSNVIDSSIGKFDGTFTDTGGDPDTNLHSVDGKINNALSFDGADDYIDTGDTFQAVFQSSFTWNQWVKPTDGHPVLEENLCGADRFGAYIKQDGTLYTFYNSAGDRVNITTDVLFTAGQQGWHMITTVVEEVSATTVKMLFYFDGIFVKASGTENIVMDDCISARNVYIGGQNAVIVVPTFTGLIDSTSLFSKKLSATEIGDLYNLGVGTETLYSQYDRYDSGGTAQGPAASTFSGLDHLEGETVSILGDGAVFPPKVVTDGIVTTNAKVFTAHIGLSSTYQVSPMRLDITTPIGTTHGSIKKISEVAISFFKTLNAQYGDGTKTYDINWRTTEVYDSPPELFTGDKIVTFDSGFSTEDNIVISGSDPLPATIRAIIPRIEKTGR